MYSDGLQLKSNKDGEGVDITCQEDYHEFYWGMVTSDGFTPEEAMIGRMACVPLPRDTPVKGFWSPTQGPAGHPCSLCDVPKTVSSGPYYKPSQYRYSACRVNCSCIFRQDGLNVYWKLLK